MIQAVAWDIDGTLVNSEPLHYLALKVACTACGISIEDLPENTFIGINMDDVWNILSPRNNRKVDKNIWLNIVNEAYTQRLDQLEVIDGAVDCIHAFYQMRIPQICVSNSCRKVVDNNIHKLNVKGMIKMSLSLDDVHIGKPDPYPYQKAAELLKVKTNKLLVVEDSHTGVESAYLAGCFVIQLCTLAFSPSEKANVHTSSLRDIISIIKRQRETA